MNAIDSTIRTTVNALIPLKIDFDPGIYPITEEDAKALKAKIESENDFTVFVNIEAIGQGIITVETNSVTANLMTADISSAIRRFIGGFDQRRMAKT